MNQTTLRSFLREHQASRFAFRGDVVDVQDLVNYYSVYLEAQVVTDGADAYFVTSRGPRPIARVLDA